MEGHAETQNRVLIRCERYSASPFDNDIPHWDSTYSQIENRGGARGFDTGGRLPDDERSCIYTNHVSDKVSSKRPRNNNRGFMLLGHCDPAVFYPAARACHVLLRLAQERFSPNSL